MASSKLILICTAFVIQFLVIADKVLVRKDILALTDDEKERILEGIFIMKNTTSKYNSSWSSFDYFAYVHRYAFDETDNGALGHGGWSFLPWHRAFNYLFEKELQEALNDTSFTMPYWDISNEASTFATLYDETFLGGDGDVNNSDIISDTARLNCDDFPIDPRLLTSTEAPLCLVREIGNDKTPTLPPSDEWWKVLNAGYDYDIEPYDDNKAMQPPYNNDSELEAPNPIMVKSFRARIEGIFPLICNASVTLPLNVTDPDLVWDILWRRFCRPLHDGVHFYIGGNIQAATATVDPIFFLLHNWIDAMWALYQDKYGLEYTFPEEYKDTILFDGGHFNGWNVTARDVFDVEKMGYVYQVQLDNRSDDDDTWWTTERMVGILIGLAVISVIVCVGCIWWGKKKKDRAGYKTLYDKSEKSITELQKNKY